MANKRNITDAEIDREAIAQNEELKTEETVRIKIPLIDRENPEIEIGINGVLKKIQRGVTLDLPKSIIEVLEHANII